MLQVRTVQFWVMSLWHLLLLPVAVSCVSTNDWDLLIFTQQWPNTVCLSYETSGSDHVCNLQSPVSWTVHGVWPTKLNTEGPGFCNSSVTFDEKQLNSIRNDLLKNWPSVQGDKDVSSLWKHEWLKHGSCAMSLESLNTEMKYFGKGLNWLKQYDMTSLLARQNVLPSDSTVYSVQQLHDIVVKELNVTPRIQCAYESKKSHPYLMEIRICFDKNLTLTGCEGTKLPTATPLTNCPLETPVFYPKMLTTPSSSRRAKAKFIRSIIELLIFLDWLI